MDGSIRVMHIECLKSAVFSCIKKGAKHHTVRVCSSLGSYFDASACR